MDPRTEPAGLGRDSGSGSEIRLVLNTDWKTSLNKLALSPSAEADLDAQKMDDRVRDFLRRERM